MGNNQRNRIEYIDALRGMTMILVVYFHIAAYGFGSYAFGYNDIIELFRMPTFFFISGWLFYKAGRIWNRQTIRNMIHKKFMVQIIPTAIFMFLYLALFGLLDISSFGSDKKGYWFTIVLFEYFIIYIFGEAILNRRNTNKGEIRVFSLILLLSVTAFYYAKYYTHYAHELGIWKDILGFLSFVKIRHIIFFWLGTFVRKNFNKFLSLTDKSSLVIFLIGIFTIIVLFPKLLSLEGIEYIAYLFAGISGTILCFTFFRKQASHFSQNTWIGRKLQLIGRRTLDIYLIHYFVLPYNLIQANYWCQHAYYNIKFVPIGLVMALIVIIICLIISWLLRLSPILRKYLFGAKI